MRKVFIIGIILFCSTSYAMTTEEICSRIGNLATYCKDLPPKIEDMRTELEYLQIQHQLEQARKGIFAEPIAIPQPEGVKITTYFEEE